MYAQDFLGGTTKYRLETMAVAPVSLDVPHILSSIDGFLQLRMYAEFQNYAGSKL